MVKWIWIWKEASVSCLKVLQQNSSETTEENANLRIVDSSEGFELGTSRTQVQESFANKRALFSRDACTNLSNGKTNRPPYMLQE